MANFDMPNVDDDFLGLFVPESSPFSPEDIIEEFKIYVFKLMNISIDVVLQEQVYSNKSRRLIMSMIITCLERNSKSFFMKSLKK